MRVTPAPQLLSTLERASLGAVARIYPAELVDEILQRYDRKEERRRVLPARLMVYFVIAMALFSASAYREVLQNLVEGLRGLRAWVDHWEVPTRGGISVARQRLGVEPLRARYSMPSLVRWPRPRRMVLGFAASAWSPWTARS